MIEETLAGLHQPRKVRLGSRVADHKITNVLKPGLVQKQTRVTTPQSAQDFRGVRGLLPKAVLFGNPGRTNLAGRRRAQRR